MNIFWLRPALQTNSSASWWRSLKITATFATALLIVFFFVLLLSVLVLSGQVNVPKFSGFNLSTTPIILEYPMNCSAWKQKNTCPSDYPKTHPQGSNSSAKNVKCPEYFRWIHQDLRHWKEIGITREMVERAREHAHFRLVILDGKIHVEKYRPSIQSRALFTMWGIVQLLRFYPGKLPDLELMFDCDDLPVIKAQEYSNTAPPLFRYCSDDSSLDIVFPDWSFWGWAEINIKPWKTTVEDIKEGNKRSKWEDRVPLAYWKGNPHVAPWRGDLLNCNLTHKYDWNTLIYIQDWDKESNQGYKQSNLGDQCTHRYKIYIEGWAWSVSEKYILSCDSPTLLITPRYYDFFIRGMVPQKHYWPVRYNDKCRSLKYAVEWGNNHTDKAQAIGKAGSHFIHEDMKMEHIYNYMFHLLNEYAKLLRFKPIIPPNAIELCPEAMACSAKDNWRKFMEESLEKSPSDLAPCTMPPPYDPQALKAFIQEKAELTEEVERWENEYWEKQDQKQ